jgi:transcriptional regulator with XRE-family HTH domain
MSVGLAPRKKVSLPDWATKIKRLRRRVGLSQTEFGSRLRYSAMTVSRWECGKQEPTAQGYIRLGQLCEGVESWWFWSRAGLKKPPK